MTRFLVQASEDATLLTNLLNSWPGAILPIEPRELRRFTVLVDDDEALMTGCAAGLISEPEPDEALHLMTPGHVAWPYRVRAIGER